MLQNAVCSWKGWSASATLAEISKLQDNCTETSYIFLPLPKETARLKPKLFVWFFFALFLYKGTERKDKDVLKGVAL